MCSRARWRRPSGRRGAACVLTEREYPVIEEGSLVARISEVAMNKEIIYSMNTAYRGEYEIQGFS